MTLHRNPLGSSWLFTFSLVIPLDDRLGVGGLYSTTSRPDSNTKVYTT